MFAYSGIGFGTTARDLTRADLLNLTAAFAQLGAFPDVGDVPRAVGEVGVVQFLEDNPPVFDDHEVRIFTEPSEHDQDSWIVTVFHEPTAVNLFVTDNDADTTPIPEGALELPNDTTTLRQIWSELIDHGIECCRIGWHSYIHSGR